MASAIDQTCIMCARQGNKCCAKCKAALYCSVDCQRLDWKNHKQLCASGNDFETSPTPQSRRGLLFPGGDELPRLIWLETEVDAMGLYEFFDFKPMFGVERIGTQNFSMSRNLIQGRDITRDDNEYLKISCLENIRPAPDNHALARFTRSGVMGTDWKGPILAMRYLAIPSRLEHYKNIDMRDVRNVADYFSSADRGCSDRTIRMNACDILCPVDAAFLRTRRFTCRTIQANDAVYLQQGSGNMNLLGLPLQAASFKIFPGPIEPRGNASGHRNPEVAELYRDINSSIKSRSAQVAEEDAARDVMVATYGPMAAMIGGGEER